MAPPRPAAGRTAIFILGAPGSGAETLARVLQASGGAAVADPGAVAAFDDRGLAEAGAGWTDPFGPRTREGAPEAEPRDDELAQARTLLRTAEAHAPILVLSDPRHTRRAALWTAALEAEGLSPGFVVLVRPPGAAAAALHASEGVTRHRGLLLWGSYMLEAERVARGGRRVTVAFDRLLADPEGELDRIEGGLGVRLPRRTWDSAAEIEALLRRDAPPAEVAATPPALAPLDALHLHLQAAAQDEPQNTDTAAEISRWFASLADVMGPVLQQVRREAGGDAPRRPDSAPAPSAELDTAREEAKQALDRAEQAQARAEILQAALAVARRRSAEAETLLQARATEASAGEREARAALAVALTARDQLRDGLELARAARGELELRLSQASEAEAVLQAAIEDERSRHGDARERLMLTGVSNIAAQARVRELRSRLHEVEAELDRRRRWLPRLLGFK